MTSPNAPDFWWQPKGLQALFLSPIGAVVSWITLRRMSKAGARVPAVIICIGNPTVGGAGKTPTAITVLKRLKEREGAKPFALTRGYGGSERGPLVVDLKQHDVRTVGDEALLLAEVAPTIVATDRVAGANLAASLGATHVVMDDGFQNAGLVKNGTLLVVDAVAGIGNGLTIPAGPLRARFRDQLERADAMLVVGDGPAERNLPVSRRKPVFKAHLRPDPSATARIVGAPVIAFAGIGRPAKFFDLLRQIGVEVVEQHPFPDHHAYSVAEITALVEKAEKKGMRVVTTSKDYARLTRPAFKGLRERVHVLPVHLEFENPVDLDTLIQNAEVRSMLFPKPEPGADGKPVDPAAPPPAVPAPPTPPTPSVLFQGTPNPAPAVPQPGPAPQKTPAGGPPSA
ncbi:tetraacyldisaccharide 4'-kinase [Aquabacter cavernae]|uniref:tetraacyldisaccharide 4'-kinase n=1 Tax=Aquabacter cavernae TaxID=2496029 RepID=UPI000F8D3065|nr:tetraacyldisaccharide 4'-kinase [Aquabacter cavernae]